MAMCQAEASRRDLPQPWGRMGAPEITTRETLPRLIDGLPDADLAVAARVLQAWRATADPVLRALLEAPLDEEPESAEERRAVPEAREELGRGDVHRLEDVRRELSL
jgi:hypothetical protein